jgi:hypothetical protein
VYVSGGTFTKQPGGVISGRNASSSLQNIASGDGYGHTVYVSSSKKRNTTVGEGVTLNSTQDGAAGGWVELMPDNLSLNETLEWLSGNAAAGGAYTVTLSGDESVAPRTLSYSGITVSITLLGGAAGRTVSLSSNGSLFTVGSGVTLTLGNNITLRGRTDNSSSLVLVNSGGKLEMNAGSKISGNTSSRSSGGVAVSSNGTFTMNGGEISGNSVSSSSAVYGGGVYSGGTFAMSGGEISGNTASYGGGGVHVSGGTFTMSGGEISGNSSSSSGGGVHVLSGEFTMNGGEISGNTSSFGGGVYVLSSYGTFTKQPGGVIYGSNASSLLQNTASSDSYGHAVYVSSSKKRNTTAGEDVTLDSTQDGAAGGWE